MAKIRWRERSDLETIASLFEERDNVKMKDMVFTPDNLAASQAPYQKLYTGVFP